VPFSERVRWASTTTRKDRETHWTRLKKTTIIATLFNFGAFFVAGGDSATGNPILAIEAKIDRSLNKSQYQQLHKREIMKMEHTSSRTSPTTPRDTSFDTPAHL
jgi:hypothetical protein